MLCMESYGRIAPMVHTAFSGEPGQPGFEKTDVFLIVRSVSAGGYSRVSKEAAGVDPVGGSPTNSKKRIKSKEL